MEKDGRGHDNVSVITEIYTTAVHSQSLEQWFSNGCHLAH